MAIITKDQQLFDKLHAKRSKQAEVLDDFAMRGIKQSVVDMYNQKAHFIYELLQNADDARASEVTFELYPKKLVFRHNGTERFTVSEDREDAIPYGHINAITAIGFSGKQQDEGNKIGKFGIGFKAIYQYSSTPEIYDETFCFRIEKFIVPTQIGSDYPSRNPKETIFVFPFDQPDKAFNDIKSKLESLNNPILFLRHLQKVSVVVRGMSQGVYSKKSKFKEVVEDITHNLYEIDNRGEKQMMHLFTRPIKINNEQKDNYYISVGYSLTEDGNIDIESRPNVFCFFPTSEKFGDICCITHAPFELVNSRQQLKDTSYNDSLKRLLANLASEALPILRDYYLKSKKTIFDGNILNIIPPKGGYWADRDDSEFRKKYIEIIKENELILSREKEYSTPDCLLMASNLSLANLISTDQLQALKGEDTHFLNAKIWGTVNGDYDLKSLLTQTLGIETFDADDLLGEITPEFMDAQSYDWVKRLYNHLHKKEHNTWEIDDDDENAWDYSACSSPIVKTSTGEWVSAYTSLGELNVFLPLKTKVDETDYKFVNEEYLKEDITRNFLRNALHLTQPDSWSYIGSVIFQHCQAKELSSEQLQHFFEFIYKYLQGIDDAEKKAEKLSEIKKSFALLTQNNSFTLLSTPIYYDSKMLKSFMSGVKCNFVASDKYADFIKRYTEERYRAFLIELGVIFRPSIQSEEYSYDGWVPSTVTKRFNLRTHTAAKYTDYYFPNIKEFADNKRKDKVTSQTLWSWLADESLSKYRYASCRYRYYSWYSAQPADSQLYTELRTLKWICINDEWVSPSETYHEDLKAAGYEITESIIEFLEIQKKERDLKELGLTDEEIQRNRIGKMVEESGLTEDEVQAALAKAKAEKAARKVATTKLADNIERTDSSDGNYQTSDAPKSDTHKDEPERKSAIEKKREEWEKMSKAPNGRPATSQYGGGKATSLDIPDLHTEANPDEPFFDNAPAEKKQSSADKRKRATEKFKRKNTEAKNAAEKAEDANELLEIFETTTPYSFLWFKLLMDLQFAEHKKSKEREFEVSFIEFEITNFGKGVSLKNPSKDLPDWIGNAGSLDVFLCSPKKTDKLASSIIKIDGSSVELAIDAKDIKKFNGVVQIKLIARDSINHIDSLRQRFIQLGFEDEYNLNENLNQTIEFIYGPPGTGKTTRLVKKLSDIINNPNGYKNILVLTPTNKAADIIATKLFDDNYCGDYLTRFGATESRDLIEEAVVQSRDTFFIDLLDRNIVVTTVARYSYDCFQPDNCAICDFDWDLIVIDEASMVDIVPMIYILYKSKGADFIIAGDPKQIEPVTQNDMPTYNIYDMVGLNSFKEAIENYKRFPIEALTTQHRSIPTIGTLVSQFAYDGLVKHDVARTTPKPLNIDGMSLQAINFVGFRTEELDRLYGLTAIGKSPFHLYSAILTYNMVRYMAEQIEKNHPGKDYTIGIVTPYSAQAEAISQMEAYHSMSTPHCKVTAGTVHRFQGDECDIMLLLLNPPANPGENSHVNNDNIINVAMSRARDYLFFLMPQSQLDGFNIKRRLRDLVPKKSTITYSELEKLLFGEIGYIERNTNITCHLPVNVYSDSMLKYEVRISDTALDIQINN